MDANDARKMKGAETATTSWVPVVSRRMMWSLLCNGPPVPRPECPAAFAAACRFVAADKPAIQDRLYTYTAGGFGQACVLTVTTAVR